jgi:6-pyruvoyltetrahydropterin/6-carboxytetrahydropterin synthase
MYLLKVVDSFDAAHRLGCGYKGKCSVPHGHSWKVAVVLKFTSLLSTGFAEDFKDIKINLKKYLDNLDHAYLVPDEDHGSNTFLDNLGDSVVYFHPNPTAEIISREVYRWMVHCGYDVDSVEVWETENNCCTYKEE